jgi:acetyltransferase-like isoleucine patch superfamily enzyme
MSVYDWIRRRESPLQKRAYAFAKGALNAQFPTIPIVHPLLGYERKFRKTWLRLLFAKIYYAPLLRRASRSVGKGLVLYEDMPKIFGNLRIELGERVILSGSNVWYACGDTSEKTLRVGDDSYIGFAAEIFSGSEVNIGRHVLIANHVLINGYDGHPLDPIARARGEGPGAGGFGPIEIGDYAWIGSKSIVLKNVRIGRGAVVASGSVVTKDVPDLTVVAGNPAKIVRTIDAPLEWQTGEKAAGEISPSTESDLAVGRR